MKYCKLFTPIKEQEQVRKKSSRKSNASFVR